MKKIDFNDNWACRHLNTDEEWKRISLPHDAMIFERRGKDCDGGANVAWFEGLDYEYKKSIFVPAEYSAKDIIFEFEGVYHNAEVFINGKLAASRAYGYTNLYVEANAFIRFGEDNEIRVVAKNSDQPNCRWYTGAGIYRPVYMYIGDKKRISLNGIKVKTLSTSPAVIEIAIRCECDGECNIEISKSGAICSLSSVFTGEDRVAKTVLTIEKADLWSPENPSLYECRVKFFGDEEVVSFGIRAISVSAENGFILNGERVIIRGACVHHDNGILGARCYREAERRKVEILKKWGYNAIRSAHNPCSKYLLKACDELGMMVLDEYCDTWYIHKSRFDYADKIEENYEKDLTDMVEKDYNHPSVVMYSLGNEVTETAEKRGIEFFKKMKNVIKALDEDRPVTVGVNIFFNFLYSIGFGVYSDEKAKKNPEKKVGSEFFNDLAGKLGAKFMKTMAKLNACDKKTRDCFAETDVAGYNYGVLRYKKDLKKYPDRVILGTETFCSDAYEFWELAKNNPALIGDFVWSGMDYLGEVGIGSWEYKEYAPEFTHGVGWISAGSGRIDLIGNPLGEAFYTKVAFGLEDKPQIAVVPVSHTGEKHSPSAWKFSNAIPSWSWNGLDGKKAKVEVYSRAPAVALYINDKKVGYKKFGKNCRFDFDVKYESGTIIAVNLDENGNEINRNSLKTAGNRSIIGVFPEKDVVKEGEIVFIKIRYSDEEGVVKPLEKGDIFFEVENGELLAAGNACPYNSEGFCSDHTTTYYGEALAVVKATGGDIRFIARDGRLEGNAEIKVIGKR